MLLCPSHGAPCPTRVCLLLMPYGTFLMYGSQCRYPLRHKDRCILLPPVIRAELSALLESMGYLEIRSIRHGEEGILLLRPTQPLGSTTVRKLRQYRRIGEYRFRSSTVLLWMLRPTVNYKDCMFVWEIDRYKSITSMFTGVISVRYMGEDVRNGVAFKYSFRDETTIQVNMSGTLVPYFLCTETSSHMEMHIPSVSLGGCTLNLTLIERDLNNNPAFHPTQCIDLLVSPC